MLQAIIDNPLTVATIMGTALVIGLVIDFIVYRVLRKVTRDRGWKVGDAIAHSLHGLPTLFAVLIGAWVAAERVGTPSESLDKMSTWLVAIAIAGITWSAARLAGRLVRVYAQSEGAAIPSSTIFVNLARWSVIAIGGVSVLAALGISIGPLIATLGVAGIAVGLALQPTLENLFAGVQVLMSRQILPGDFVQLETGEQGWVDDMNWRNTTIKLLTNDLVIVPNSVIGKSRVTNFTTKDAQHVIWVNVGVAYGSDLERVEEATLDVARSVLADMDCTVSDYEPQFRYDAFGDSSIELRVSLRARAYADRWPIQSEFIKRLHVRYAAEGIEIPFPQRVVHMAAQSD